MGFGCALAVRAVWEGGSSQLRRLMGGVPHGDSYMALDGACDGCGYSGGPEWRPDDPLRPARQVKKIFGWLGWMCSGRGVEISAPKSRRWLMTSDSP